MMKFFIPCFFLSLCSSFYNLKAQNQPANYIRLINPVKETAVVASSKFYIVGQTVATAKLMLDTLPVKVYTTGTFAQPLILNEGTNTFKLISILEKDTVIKTLTVTYNKPTPPKPTEGFAIEYVKTIPNDDQWLQPGDRLQVVMKATPGMRASFLKGIDMVEVDSAEAGVRGIYRGEYLIKQGDTIAAAPVEFRLNDNNNILKAETETKLTILSGEHSLIGLSTGDRPYLDYGLGTDRLGGAKLGYIDTMVQLNITGKFGDDYRVKLADNQQAYIPKQNVRLLNGGHFAPTLLSGNWTVSSDDEYDYLSVSLDKKLPYSSSTLLDPNRIVINVYGATSNTNWIIQKQTAEIKNTWYEQISKDVLQINIDLKHAQLWGYEVYYKGNNLVVKIRHQPQSFDLSKLTIGIDAGHGGNNMGADGLMGELEKNITLSIALKLKAEFEKLGTKVIMTRTNDTSFNNGARLKYMKAQNPDLLISIHCNSADNPTVQGNSTYYKYLAFRPLTQSVHSEILKMGLADYGNVGNFNFFFSAPTEYPNVLVETAFLSNPEDEEKIIQDSFQQQMAEAIVRGIKNFLQMQTPDNIQPPPPIAEEPSSKKKKKHTDSDQ
jgi:N-acetylmuramoyl-L-alanine amidase